MRLAEAGVEGDVRVITKTPPPVRRRSPRSESTPAPTPMRDDDAPPVRAGRAPMAPITDALDDDPSDSPTMEYDVEAGAGPVPTGLGDGVDDTDDRSTAKAGLPLPLIGGGIAIVGLAAVAVGWFLYTSQPATTGTPATPEAAVEAAPEPAAAPPPAVEPDEPEPLAEEPVVAAPAAEVEVAEPPPVAVKPKKARPAKKRAPAKKPASRSAPSATAPAPKAPVSSGDGSLVWSPFSDGAAAPAPAEPAVAAPAEPAKPAVDPDDPWGINK
jgi:hypothetical protein